MLKLTSGSLLPLLLTWISNRAAGVARLQALYLSKTKFFVVL